MARIAFVYDDVALVSLGATAPSMTSEDTAFPRANILHPDRKVRTRTIVGPASTVDHQIDLGAAKAISGFCVNYLISDAAAGAHPVMDLRSGSSFGSTTSRATQTAAYWNTTKDWVDTFAALATFTDRYWILRCTGVAARYSIGKVQLGTGKDFQRLYSDAEFRWVSPNARAEAADHSVVDMPQGSPYRLYDYKYFAETDPDVLVFERLAQQTVPWGLLDSRGNSNHVVLANPGDGMPFEAMFDPMWNVRVAARQMP